MLPVSSVPLSSDALSGSMVVSDSVDGSMGALEDESVGGSVDDSVGDLVGVSVVTSSVVIIDVIIGEMSS